MSEVRPQDTQSGAVAMRDHNTLKLKDPDFILATSGQLYTRTSVEASAGVPGSNWICSFNGSMDPNSDS